MCGNKTRIKIPIAWGKRNQLWAFTCGRERRIEHLHISQSGWKLIISHQMGLWPTCGIYHLRTAAQFDNPRTGAALKYFYCNRFWCGLSDICFVLQDILGLICSLLENEGVVFDSQTNQTSYYGVLLCLIDTILSHRPVVMEQRMTTNRITK